MHQFVQSAIEAAKQGDNEKAVNFLKQVLSANPNDVDAWLVLAAVVEEPQRKRQCLRRVLAIDPVNQVAQEELMEMDRAEMGSTLDAFGQTYDQPDSVSTDMYEPETPESSSSSSSFAYEPEEPEETEESIPPVQSFHQQKPSSTDQAPPKNPAGKTLVFKFPAVWLVLIFFLAALFGCVGLLVATRNIFFSLPFLGFSALMLAAAVALLQKVEVNRKGIRVSSLFSNAESNWDDIAEMKSNTMLRRLELTKNNGEAVNIYTFINGYPRIMTIIQRMRPDLFSTETHSPT